nr:DUF4347 domain-containing protein [Microcoleaceae cyanobacterium MO_207.B10]
MYTVSNIRDRSTCQSRKISNFFTKKFKKQQQIVFIDSKVKDYQILANGVLSEIELVIIKADRDGIEQITETLEKYTTISSIHIVSHGSPGCLYLGNSKLNLNTIKNYAKQLQNWSVSHLLLYGCHVAQGNEGAEFITQLHQLTRAEIAASAKPIGNSALGGDWHLEITTSKFDLPPVFEMEAIERYKYVLIAVIDWAELDWPDEYSGLATSADSPYPNPPVIFQNLDNSGIDLTFQFEIEPGVKLVEVNDSKKFTGGKEEENLFVNILTEDATTRPEISLVIEFSKPIAYSAFSIFDVDGSPVIGNWQDDIKVQSFFNNELILPTSFTNGNDDDPENSTFNLLDGYIAKGIVGKDANNNSNNGNVNIVFDTIIDTLKISYRDGEDAKPKGNETSLGVHGSGLLSGFQFDSAPEISINDVTVNESEGLATFTVTLDKSRSVDGDITVEYTTNNDIAIAGSDYLASSGIVTIPTGQTEATVTIAIEEDEIYEGDESFIVQLFNPTKALINDGEAEGTIIDNDNPPNISINDTQVTEGQPAVFTLSLDQPSEQ